MGCVPERTIPLHAVRTPVPKDPFLRFATSLHPLFASFVRIGNETPARPVRHGGFVWLEFRRVLFRSLHAVRTPVPKDPFLRFATSLHPLFASFVRIGNETPARPVR